MYLGFFTGLDKNSQCTKGVIMKHAIMKYLPKWNRDTAMVSPGKDGSIFIHVIVEGCLRYIRMPSRNFENHYFTNHLVEYFETGIFPMEVRYEMYSSSCGYREVVGHITTPLHKLDTGEMEVDFQALNATMTAKRKELGDLGFNAVPLELKEPPLQSMLHSN